MANLIINSYRVLDSNQNPLPQNGTTLAFIAPFYPTVAQTRFSDKLYLEVNCAVLNAVSQPIQAYFKINLLNAFEYDFFEYGQGSQIRYYKQVSNGKSVFLPFRLTNRGPINQITNAQIVLTGKDSEVGSPQTTRRFQIQP